MFKVDDKSHATVQSASQNHDESTSSSAAVVCSVNSDFSLDAKKSIYNIKMLTTAKKTVNTLPTKI